VIFGVLNPKKWHQQLVHLATLPVYCSHFTLRDPKSHFSTVLFIHTSDYLHYLRKNKLQLFTYLRCRILWSAFTSLVSHFVYLAADPQPALFRTTNIWETQHYLTVRCNSFAFYKVVRWYFLGVVGKGVTVCSFLR